MRHIFLIFVLVTTSLFAKNTSPHILHLTFHRGCQREIEEVGELLNWSVTSWHIPSLENCFFDPETENGCALYNMGSARATRIWNAHKDFFNSFDCIIISDTAPLSRIFLQHEFEKPLIIWICNRFDYSDQGSLDCPFPDQAYYDLFQQGCYKKNVRVVANTPFEHLYAASKGVHTGNLLIKPCSPLIEPVETPIIPETIAKEETFFLPKYHNETLFLNLNKLCKRYKIPSYQGPFSSPEELKNFKGIIHLPYAYSNIAFFVNMQLGLPYFIPSQKFLSSLISHENYWHQNRSFLQSGDGFSYSEWYLKEHQEIITYFDSWMDLKEKIRTANFPLLREKVLQRAQKHREAMLHEWRSLLEDLL